MKTKTGLPFMERNLLLEFPASALKVNITVES